MTHLHMCTYVYISSDDGLVISMSIAKYLNRQTKNNKDELLPTRLFVCGSFVGRLYNVSAELLD